MNTDHFKQKLEAELQTVETELQTVGQKNAQGDWEASEKEMDVMPAPADPNEAADKIEEYNEHRAILEGLEGRYKDIKDALAKIESGTFGICEVSGDPIEEDRLEVNPAARTNKANM
jgi:RNA polymerase-binding transcription factor DksA